jgi:hypothetical protein
MQTMGTMGKGGDKDNKKIILDSGISPLSTPYQSHKKVNLMKEGQLSESKS